jgi:hypothetical protein
MSLAGRAALRGSVIAIYRPLETETGDLGRKVLSWTPIESGLDAIITSETDELMQKVFGTPELVRDRLYLPGTHDLQPGDAVKATARKRVGETWRVRAVLTLNQSFRPHKEAALESTPEVIP